MSSFDIHIYGQNADGFTEHCIQMKEFFGDYSFYFISSICTICIRSINRYWLAKNVFTLVRPLKLKTVKSLLEYFFILGTEKKYKTEGSGCQWSLIFTTFAVILIIYSSIACADQENFLIFKGGGSRRLFGFAGGGGCQRHILVIL